MPYKSGIVYTDTSVNPPLGVSIYDVQRALGTSKQYLNELCTHPSVKTWAKYKPQKINYTYQQVNVQQITEEQRKARNYGITNIPTWTSLLNMMRFWTATDTSNPPSCGIQDSYWTWDAPTGGIYPYRLTDFEKYFVYAEPPVGGVKEVSGEASNIVTIVFNMGMAGVTTGLTVTLSDLAEQTSSIAGYGNLYFGVGIKAGSSFYYATQSNTVGDMNTSGWTLWSMGAHARFKIDSNSGALYDCITSGTPFQVFPMLSGEKNFLEENGYANKIRAISGDVTGKTFIPLNPVESVTLTMQFIEGTINLLTAWKNEKVQPIGKYVYFTFSFTNSDPTSPHDFAYDIYALKSDGSVVNSTVNHAVNNLGAGATHAVLSGTLDISTSYSAAVRFRLVVRCTEAAVTLKRDTEMTVVIEDDMRAA